jgi:hypothetical protein
LLSCPRFAAQRTNLLTSAAQVCGQEWQVGSDNEKVTFMLKGSTQLSYKEIVRYLVLYNVIFWILVDSPSPFLHAIVFVTICSFC